MSNQDQNTAQPISAEASSKQINDKIDGIVTRSKNVNEDIQAALIMIMVHATGVGTGDVTGAKRLLNKLPDNFDKPGIVKFLSLYTPIYFVKTGDMFEAKLRKETDTKRDGTSLYVPWNIDGAKAHKWYELSAERMKRELELFTADAAIDMVQKQIDRFKKLLDQEVKQEVKVEGGSTVKALVPRVQGEDRGLLRAIIVAMEQTRRDYKADKLKPINDDNTIDHSHGSTGEEGASQTKTGTDG